MDERSVGRDGVGLGPTLHAEEHLVSVTGVLIEEAG